MSCGCAAACTDVWPLQSQKSCLTLAVPYGTIATIVLFRKRYGGMLQCHTLPRCSSVMLGEHPSAKRSSIATGGSAMHNWTLRVTVQRVLCNAEASPKETA